MEWLFVGCKGPCSAQRDEQRSLVRNQSRMSVYMSVLDIRCLGTPYISDSMAPCVGESFSGLSPLSLPKKKHVLCRPPGYHMLC